MSEITRGSQGVAPGDTLKRESQARLLVALYNNQAADLADTVKKIHALIQESSVISAFIIPGGGWKNNALEEIPMLKVKGEDFPKLNRDGMILDMKRQQVGSHFSEGNPADFAVAEGYSVTAEAMIHHQEALCYAEQHGVDYITAAIKTDRGNK
jgi:hypothetical protein